MTLAFFITARLKSQRLPRKVLIEIEGQSVLGHVIERAKQVRGLDDVVVCTSPVSQDRPIVDVCRQHGCKHYIGSPDDVLNRLLSAATVFSCDYLLLITADNPLFSYEYAQRLVDDWRRDPDFDYLYVTGLPLGMDAYMVRRKAFELIDAFKNENDTEFWPEYLQDRSVFKHRSIQADTEHAKDYRLTLDYPQDLELFNSIYRDCYDGKPIKSQKIFEYLDSNPAVAALNSATDRSWLDPKRVDNIRSHFESNRDRLLALKREIYGALD